MWQHDQYHFHHRRSYRALDSDGDNDVVGGVLLIFQCVAEIWIINEHFEE